MAKKTYIEQPFLNHIGQEIQPGDKVLTIAGGYAHQQHTRVGVYLGMVGSSPTTLVEDRVWGYWDENGKNVGWSRNPAPSVKAEQRNVMRRSTLPGGRVYKIV